MVSRIRRSVLVTVALAGGVALAVACGGSGGTGYTSNPTPMTGGTGGGGGGTTAPADVTIQIAGMNGPGSFTPSPGSVKAGQTVAWHNQDMVGHTATGSSFDTGVVAPGATSAPIKFDTAGTLSYRCSIHPSMTGTLTVTP
jgi:plastocyanin